MGSLGASVGLGLIALAQPPPTKPTTHVQVPVADGFDHPVGPPDASGYYNAQPFGRNEHLGDDWNGLGGGDTDLGDPVYSVAHGRVVSAGEAGPGWGPVVRVVHRLPDGAEIESIYAHLDTISVSAGSLVKRGAVLGSIGTAHGAWVAHLHLEIREQVGRDLGGGYGHPNGHVDPSAFIASHPPPAE